MTNIIVLDVGGVIFKTTEDSLLMCPYFKSLKNVEGMLSGTNEKPYFIDRDPKIFRHLLNFLRNPEYDFPEKYYCELKFWGFDVTNIKKKELELSFPLFENAKLDFIPNCKSDDCLNFSKNPQITHHKRIFKKSTFNLYNLDGIFFDQVPWNYNLKGDFTIEKSFILIPEFISFDKLKYFKIKIKINELNYENKFCLDFLPYNTDRKIFIINGFHYIPLYILVAHEPFPVLKFKDIEISFDCDDSKYILIKTGIKFYKSELESYEKSLFLNQPLTINFYDVKETEIKNGFALLDRNHIRYLIWHTEEKVNELRLVKKNDNENSYYKLNRGEFQFLERGRIESNLKSLPLKYGCLYFCSDPHKYDSESGALCCKDDYHIEFDKKTNGTLWQFYMISKQLNLYNFL